MKETSDGGMSRDEGGGVDGNWMQAAQRHYDPERDTELTTALVYAIAEAADVPPTDLKSPPLYECVDAAALENTFFGQKENGEQPESTGTVEFHYADYRVTVRNDGWIQVYETADTDTPDDYSS